VSNVVPPTDVTVQLLAKGNSGATATTGRFDNFTITTPRCP
jgi:hypothetical protein